MSNIRLNNDDCTDIHARGIRLILAGIDNTTTVCGGTFPTRAFVSTLKAVNCQDCKAKGTR